MDDLGVVDAVEADGAAQHEAQSVADRDAQGEVELVVALLGDGVLHGAGLEDVHAVQAAVVHQALVEGRELVGGGDGVGRRDDPGEEARVVREVDDVG